jgi:hypothetical protein
MATYSIGLPRTKSTRETTAARAVETGPAARASWPTVRIETDGATYVGAVCVPETLRRFSDLLADERPFLHLVQVSINGSKDLEPFLALNKRFIRTVRIVDEGKPADLVLVPPAD